MCVSNSKLRPANFRDLSKSLLILANEAPERTTLAQMTFFLLAGTADLAGKPSTFTEIRDRVGPTVNRSLHTTYKVFLDRPLKRSDYQSKRQGLGWLTREIDPQDNRRNYLRLTAKGRRVLAKALGA